jgi:hypothetical protein
MEAGDGYLECGSVNMKEAVSRAGMLWRVSRPLRSRLEVPEARESAAEEKLAGGGPKNVIRV